MDNYENFLPKAPEKKKIPYDSEPIMRGSRSSATAAKTTGTSPAITILVVMLCVVCAVFSVLFGVLFTRKNNGSVISGNYPDSNFKDNQTVTQQPISDTATGYAMRSAVTIQARFRNAQGKWGYNAGSGVIIDDTNGYVTIVTNYHVLYAVSLGRIATDNIYIYLYNYINPEENFEFSEASQIKCEYVGGSYQNDIGVIRFYRGTVDNPTAAEKLYSESYAQPAAIGDSNELSFGDPVFAVGNPNAAGINVTTGVISKIFTFINVDVKSDKTAPFETIRCIQTDTPINGGNSGGGLFDKNGHWIGIVNAKQEELENTAFAIPVNVAFGIAWNILKNAGTLKVCNIGIELENRSYTELDDKGAVQFKNKVTVVSLATGTSSVGLKAGIKAGDVIKSVTYLNRAKGTEVTVDIDRAYMIQEQLFYVNTGDKMTMVVERAGKTETLTLTFGGATIIE